MSKMFEGAKKKLFLNPVDYYTKPFNATDGTSQDY